MAYNRYYQYDTNPRKLKPDYEPVKRMYPKKSSARKENKHAELKKTRTFKIKTVFYIAMCFIALFVISYRYSVIDDTYMALKEKKADLAVIAKETTQLEANLESSLNLTKIEEEAKKQLGMQKLSTEQIVYVTLPKTDHVETSSKEIKSVDYNQNFIMEIINKITSSFK